MRDPVSTLCGTDAMAHRQRRQNASLQDGQRYSLSGPLSGRFGGADTYEIVRLMPPDDREGPTA